MIHIPSVISTPPDATMEFTKLVASYIFTISESKTDSSEPVIAEFQNDKTTWLQVLCVKCAHMPIYIERSRTVMIAIV